MYAPIRVSMHITSNIHVMVIAMLQFGANTTIGKHTPPQLRSRPAGRLPLIQSIYYKGGTPAPGHVVANTSWLMTRPQSWGMGGSLCCKQKYVATPAVATISVIAAIPTILTIIVTISFVDVVNRCE